MYFPFGDTGLGLYPLSMFFICRCPWWFGKAIWHCEKVLLIGLGSCLGYVDASALVMEVKLHVFEMVEMRLNEHQAV